MLLLNPTQPHEHLVMQYMGRGSLAALIRDSESTLSPDLVISIALDVAQGMHYLHSQKPAIIHRSLLPPPPSTPVTLSLS